jgi:hypothetical protein
MKGSILRGKRILAVGGEPDILEVIGRKILEACPSCQFDKAIHYIEAVERMVSFTYDLVILYIGGVRGFDLLDLAQSRNLQVAILTTNSKSFNYAIERGASACLAREKPGECVPILEDILRYKHFSCWRRHCKSLGRLLSTQLSSCRSASHPPVNLLKSRYGDRSAT